MALGEWIPWTEAELPSAIGKLILGGIEPEVGKRGARYGAVEEKIVKQPDRVTDVQAPVVIDVSGIDATNLSSSQEEEVEQNCTGSKPCRAQECWSHHG